MADSGDFPSALRQPPQKELLRFLTCGSVDDGKSTLIGRLLHDAGQVTDDQLQALERDSRRYGARDSELDFALLLDGLEAERQQGITIDVAYRFFSTGRRAFIVADTPGHEQYTRNMATGASTSDLAVILVDVRKGLSEQTRRHTLIAGLLGIRQLVLAVNKMDLVDWSPELFQAVEGDFNGFAAALGFNGVIAIPMSAKSGDNVGTRSALAPWWRGPTLLEHLERVDVSEAPAEAPFRFAVQWVNRPGAEFRGYSGTIASGAVQLGQEVVVASSGRTSRVSGIITADGEVQRGEAGEAVTLTLADEFDLGRGELLSGTRDRPQVGDRLSAQVLWLGEAPLSTGRGYLLKIGTRQVGARITAVGERLAFGSSADPPASDALQVNQIAVCEVATAEVVAFDAYAENRRTGGFILIDPATNATVAAGLIQGGLRRSANVHRQDLLVRRGDRERLQDHRGACLWFTGLSGAGKSTIAALVERELHDRGLRTYLLDGDNLRHGLCGDLGFSEADRAENVRRVAEVAKLFVDSGAVVLCALISPNRAARASARALFEEGDFVEIHVDTPPEVCSERDPKGLYAKARAGAISDLTGVGSPYEPPEQAELVVDGALGSPQHSAQSVLAVVLEHLRRERPPGPAGDRPRPSA